MKGVGEGINVAVAVGVGGVGVKVGVMVKVTVGVTVGSMTHPVRCKPKNTIIAPITKKSANKPNAAGKPSVIDGIRLPRTP